MRFIYAVPLTGSCRRGTATVLCSYGYTISVTVSFIITDHYYIHVTTDQTSSSCTFLAVASNVKASHINRSDHRPCQVPSQNTQRLFISNGCAACPSCLPCKPSRQTAHHHSLWHKGIHSSCRESSSRLYMTIHATVPCSVD